MRSVLKERFSAQGIRLRNGLVTTSLNGRTVVASSPDLATRPTEGLQIPQRQETFGPDHGGVRKPAPNQSGSYS